MAGELIAEFGRHPTHYGRLTNSTLTHQEKNISCGEEMTVDVLLSDAGEIDEIAFEAEGRMVIPAAMSLLCQELEGELLARVEEYDQQAVLDLLEVEHLSAKQLKSALLGLLALKNMYRKYKGEEMLDFGDVIE
jgi:NifU-like protein involved in Fe-S cluster formation